MTEQQSTPSARGNRLQQIEESDHGSGVQMHFSDRQRLWQPFHRLCTIFPGVKQMMRDVTEPELSKETHSCHSPLMGFLRCSSTQHQGTRWKLYATDNEIRILTRDRRSYLLYKAGSQERSLLAFSSEEPVDGPGDDPVEKSLDQYNVYLMEP